MAGGWLRAVGDAGPTIRATMKDFEDQAREIRERPLREEAQRLTIQGQRADVAVKEQQAQKIKEEMAREKDPWDPGKEFQVLDFLPEDTKKMTDWVGQTFKKSEITGLYTQGDKKRAYEMLKTNVDMMKQYSQFAVNKAESVVVTAQKKLAQLREKSDSDPESIRKAKNDYDTAMTNYYAAKKQIEVIDTTEQLQRFADELGIGKELPPEILKSIKTSIASRNLREGQETLSKYALEVNKNKTTSNIAKPSPRDFTLESLANYAKSGNMKDLKRIEKTMDVIENAKGEQKYIEKGSLIPPGWKVQKGAATNVTIEDKRGETVFKETVKEMPKLKTEAFIAKGGIESISKALGMINKGGVTGKGGQIKAWIAPYAEAIGYKGEDLSDAQAFQLLARAIVGPMRLEIVGSGQVSNFEQELMMKISGGGGAAKGAAVTLLNHWKNRAAEKVMNYNSTVKGLSKQYPEITDIYGTIDLGKPEEEISKTKTIGNKTYIKKNGKWFEQ